MKMNHPEMSVVLFDQEDVIATSIDPHGGSACLSNNPSIRNQIHYTFESAVSESGVAGFYYTAYKYNQNTNTWDHDPNTSKVFVTEGQAKGMNSNNAVIEGQTYYLNMFFNGNIYIKACNGQ